MSKEYFIVRFVVENTERFLIWYTDNIDGFVRQDNHVVSFSDSDSATRFCKENSIAVNDGIESFDISNIIGFTDVSAENEGILNFWNIASDFALSVNEPFKGDSAEYTEIYAKLVKSCDLPALHNKPTSAVLSDKELSALKTIMSDGALIIEKNLK